MNLENTAPHIVNEKTALHPETRTMPGDDVDLQQLYKASAQFGQNQGNPKFARAEKNFLENMDKEDPKKVKVRLDLKNN